jgi:hypothetical protein
VGVLSLFDPARYVIQVWHYGRNPWRVSWFGGEYDDIDEAQSFVDAAYGPFEWIDVPDIELNTYVSRVYKDKKNVIVIHTHGENACVVRAAYIEADECDLTRPSNSEGQEAVRQG